MFEDEKLKIIFIGCKKRRILLKTFKIFSQDIKEFTPELTLKINLHKVTFKCTNRKFNEFNLSLRLNLLPGATHNQQVFRCTAVQLITTYSAPST